MSTDPRSEPCDAVEEPSASFEAANFDRRGFLRVAGAGAAAAWLGPRAIARPAPLPAPAPAPPPPSGSLAPTTAVKRRRLAYVRRVVDARKRVLKTKLPKHASNGDEDRYENRIASFTKGLPHDAAGEVESAAYAQYLGALESGLLGSVEILPYGCSDPAKLRPWVNPLGGLTFDGLGYDPAQMEMPPAPTFASAAQASEAVELYWMAALRDVAFTDYAGSTLAQQAAAELAAAPAFDGPAEPGLLFRTAIAGSLAGPFVSQLLLRPVPWGALATDPRLRTTAPGDDHLTSFGAWLEAQRGCEPETSATYDATPRHVRNARDLAEWVHRDALFQAFVQAAVILATPPDPSNPITGGGLGAPRNPSNPYGPLLKQAPFASFGDPWVQSVVAEAAIRGLRAVWFQKWFVHRRLRPEVFGGRVHRTIANGAGYPLHGSVLGSQAVAQAFSTHGTYLLPQAYPEGSPLHPSYGAGHATVAGACATVLKALFREDHPIASPVVPDGLGTALVPYLGADAGGLTVGGEIDKLAWNVAVGRNMAGIHWRTDGEDSLRLGEEVAIGLLASIASYCHEAEFTGFTFTRFDGTTITV